MRQKIPLNQNVYEIASGMAATEMIGLDREKLAIFRVKKKQTGVNIVLHKFVIFDYYYYYYYYFFFFIFFYFLFFFFFL